MLTLGTSSSKTLLMGGLLLLAFGLVTTGFTQEKLTHEMATTWVFRSGWGIKT